MNSKYAGSCLCGETRFEIAGEFEQFFLCHCEYCRKDTGSAHAANLFSTTATLQWVAGKENSHAVQPVIHATQQVFLFGMWVGAAPSTNGWAAVGCPGRQSGQ